MVAAYVVDIQSGFLSDTAPVSMVWPDGFGRFLSFLPGTSRFRSELVSGSVLREEMG